MCHSCYNRDNENQINMNTEVYDLLFYYLYKDQDDATYCS